MKKIIVTGIILFIIGLVGASIMVFQNMGLETETPFKYQKQTDGNTVNNIIVNSDSSDIEIYPSQNNQISAIFTGSKQKNVITDLQLSTKGNTVEIDAKREEKSKILWINFNIGINKQSPKVAVYLPKKQYESLALKTSNGDIKLDDYQGKTVNANTANGDVRFQKTNAALTVQTSNGDINLSEMTFHDRNSVTTSSGDIHIQSISNPEASKKAPQDQLILRSSSGDIDITGYQGSALTANTSSGDIHLQNIDAAFSAHSENGDINIQSIPAFYAQNQVTTNNGDIKFSVGHDPKSLNVDFTGGSVHSAFPIQTQGTTATSTDEYETRQLKGLIGANTANSPTLTMHTQNGEINFNR